MPHWVSTALAFFISLGIAYLLTPRLKSLALRFGFQDKPNPRRNSILKPRLGGVAVYLAFLSALAVTAVFVEGRTAEEWRKLAGLVLGGLVVVVMGILDDRRELGALPQLGAQLLASAGAVASGIMIYRVTNPFGTPFVNSMFEFPLYLAVIFSIVWLTGAMNAINFIDGLDGLAAGVAAIAGLVLFAHSYKMGQYTIALLPLALTGATLGFLRYNFFPAQITLGTSGAMFLGYALGAMSIIAGTKAATVLLVLGLPLLDGAWIITRRILHRRSPFHADRSHLHHRLAEMGLSTRQIVLLYYTISAAFGILALVLSSRILKLYALVGMALLVAAIIALVTLRRLEEKG